MSRIRDYSANQLDRVHENYIFQRQRLRKFSAQNYLKVQVPSLGCSLPYLANMIPVKADKNAVIMLASSLAQIQIIRRSLFRIFE